MCPGSKPETSRIFHLVESHRQATPFGLQEGLLPGPAFEKCLLLLGNRKPTQDLHLGGGEEMLRDVVVSEFRTYPFKVNTELVSHGDRQKRASFRMCEVEVDGGVVHEPRFALVSIVESDVPRDRADVGTQNPPQHKPAHQVPPLVPTESEAPRSRQFVRGKQLLII